MYLNSLDLQFLKIGVLLFELPEFGYANIASF